MSQSRLLLNTFFLVTILGLIVPQVARAVLIDQSDPVWSEYHLEELLELDLSLTKLKQIAQADPRQLEADQLRAEGKEQAIRSNWRAALTTFQRALAIYQDIGDRTGEAKTLHNIGVMNKLLGNYSEALDYYAQSLAVKRDIGDRADEAPTLISIGEVHRVSGDYSEALNYYNQGLIIIRESGDRSLEAQALNNIGIVHQFLGNYSEALDYLNQSLMIVREIDAHITEARITEARALSNIGIVHQSLENYSEALDYYNQGLVIAREIGDRATEARIINNIGNINRSFVGYSRRLDSYLQSLEIARELGDRASEVLVLNNIGKIHHRLSGKYSEALDYFTQSLVITREIGDRATEALTLANIGLLFETQDNPDLAILFLKEAVNAYETIRTDNQELSLEDQKSYTETVADNYRTLADLLLEQGRIPEAQQVLDLLQLEELREFTDTRAVWTSNGIRLSEPEQTVADAHGSLIALGSKVVECERNNCTNLDTLYSQQESLLAQYNTTVARFVEIIRANRRNDDIFQNPDSISGDAQKLLDAYALEEQNTLLVYPFVLEDKLWLVWVSVGDVIGSVEVPVGQGELATKVQQFGALLKSRSSDIAELQATSQKLYSWIIEPIAAELETNNIDHLVFVNDRVTRYIPMGALYDGENYLLENYTVSTVLSPAATDMGARLGPVPNSNVLGLGLTEAVENFNSLPAVRDELAGIIKGRDGNGIYPGQAFLNQDFTFDAFKDNVQGNHILHIATHAAFEPGRPEESFIVLGDGSRMKIPDIETMQRRLRNLHLVVLSACQTALGGTNQEDGTEITGLSSYFLKANRAEAVVASFWSVNDGSTSVLMQRFYENMAAGDTKAEALRKAQLSLLGSDQTADGDARIIGQRPADAEAIHSQLSHPYYWAPFILIGNGL
ncbi:MAG: CHAT domain-containing protein [Cyanobacteria bacterium P01_C01_bin.118]